MNLTLASAIFAASLPIARAGEEVQSTVRFSNNNLLAGSMESLSTDRLVWKSPVLERPTPFFLKNVVDLTLSAETPEPGVGHEASVTLTNGDLVRGQLVSVSDSIIELETGFAGLMKLNRLMVSDIRINERPEFVYRGPTGLDGWKQSGAKPAWTYQNSSFRSGAAGGIARNVNLPDECSIAFDAAWKSSFSLKLVFFSDDLASDRATTGYEFTFQQRSIQLRSGKTQRFLGQTPNATALQENEKARIEVRASLKSGTICIFVDGEIIEKWTDPEVARNEIGRGIHFIAMNPSPVQISRIEIGNWDGEVDQLPDPQAAAGRPIGMADGDDEEASPAPAAKPESGRMELRNGDSVAGEVLSIIDGMITVKTPFRDVKLPIGNLRSVALKPVDLERCKRENGDVRGWLPDGSSLVFRLEAVGDGALTGYSQNFGINRFKIAAFSRIEFNIYDRALEDIRMANGW